jgi:hypothetical protein
MANYRVAEATALSQATVVQTWTGDLTPLDLGGCNFEVPINWADWHRVWDEPAAHDAAGVPPMRLRVFASRVTGGRLRTQLLCTSPTVPDDEIDVGVAIMWGSPLLAPKAFEEDDCFMVPELDFRFDAEDGNYMYDKIELGFQMCYPQSHSENMTSRQLLRYLDYCLPW